jgi:glycosyltransferase involved in cell wall biosynthesis
LESFSGTYVEAMYHGKPVFTSDLDFAKTVCGDAAFYFNPLRPDSIIDSIRDAHKNPDLILSKIALSKERLTTFLSWQQVFDKFLGIIAKYQVKA